MTNLPGDMRSGISKIASWTAPVAVDRYAPAPRRIRCSGGAFGYWRLSPIGTSETPPRGLQ